MSNKGGKTPKKILEISGHHLHTPASLIAGQIKDILEADSIKIVDHHDTFCKEECKLGCDYGITPLKKTYAEADRAIAEHYGYEIGRCYTPSEFMSIFSKISEQKSSEGNKVNSQFFHTV